MRWIQSGLLGISGWLSAVRRPVAASARQVDAIRDSMLAALGTAGVAGMPRLAARIRYCSEPLALWELRVELMGAVSNLYGETRARQLLQDVTSCFNGVVPYACAARPSQSRAGTRRHGAVDSRAR